MLNNNDFNIDQNNHDYDFCYNREAFVWELYSGNHQKWLTPIIQRRLRIETDKDWDGNDGNAR